MGGGKRFIENNIEKKLKAEAGNPRPRDSIWLCVRKALHLQTRKSGLYLNDHRVSKLSWTQGFEPPTFPCNSNFEIVFINIYFYFTYMFVLSAC